MSITVLQDDDDADWYLLGKKSFARAYAGDEPEISLEKINKGENDDFNNHAKT